MADMNEIREIVKLAVDSYKGNVEQYSTKQSQEALYQALIAANNGSTKLNYRDIRDGKCQGLFTIIEEILNQTVIEGLRQDDFFNTLVDYRNLDEGDQNLFVVEDANLFVVDDVANGTQGIRRQRLGGETTVTIPTSMHMIRIYEELNRILSGRVDFNYFINKVADSFRQKILSDVYTLWSGATAADMGGLAYFPTAGSYVEGDLLDVISHVEAAADGKPAMILGTKKALRTLAESVQSDGAKEELHNYGYYGNFFGTKCFAVPQRHVTGTTTFQFPDDVLTIIATSEKPFKFVYEGDPIILMGDPMQNADLTQEYLYGVKYGMGIVLAGGNSGIGRYEW